MIPVKEVRLERAEGPAALCESKTFFSLDEASAWLRSQANTFPPPGQGCHKVFFTITFPDGDSYLGRLDCKKNEIPDVQEQFVGFCTWMGGREKSPWCGEEQYRHILDRYGEKKVAAFAAFLDRHLPG